MKNRLILLVVVLPVLLHGQDFQNICSPLITFYKSPASALKAFRRDSVALSGINDSTFYSYRTIRTRTGMVCKDTVGGSVMGRKVFKSHDGWFWFFNCIQDTIFLNSQGVIGDSWRIFNLPNGSYLQAQITAVEMDTVLGNPDQVKIITIQAKNSLGNNIPHLFNQKQIRLSKHYGISKLFDLYLFPNDTVSYTLCGKTSLSLGVHDLIWKDIYNYEEGDIFHYQGNVSSQYGGGGWSTIYRVLSKTVYGNNDSVEYTMEYCKHLAQGYPPVVTNTFDTITVKYNWALYDLNYAFLKKLPEEFVNSGAYADQYFEKINNINGRHLKGRDINKYSYEAATNCWSFYGYGVIPIWTYHYVEGLGQTYYSYYVIPEFLPTSSEEKLVYFKKGSETWGTPVSTSCNTLVAVEDQITLPGVQVLVCPNPVSSKSVISFKNLDPDQHPEVFIMDLFGRVVFRSRVKTNEIIFNRESVPSGIYILRVNNSNGLVCPAIRMAVL